MALSAVVAAVAASMCATSCTRMYTGAPPSSRLDSHTKIRIFSSIETRKPFPREMSWT